MCQEFSWETWRTPALSHLSSSLCCSLAGPSPSPAQHAPASGLLLWKLTPICLLFTQTSAKLTLPIHFLCLLKHFSTSISIIAHIPVCFIFYLLLCINFSLVNSKPSGGDTGEKDIYSNNYAHPLYKSDSLMHCT